MNGHMMHNMPPHMIPGAQMPPNMPPGAFGGPPKKGAVYSPEAMEQLRAQKSTDRQLGSPWLPMIISKIYENSANCLVHIGIGSKITENSPKYKNSNKFSEISESLFTCSLTGRSCRPQSKRELLAQRGIEELSPIARAQDGKSDNPACTNHLAYNTIKKHQEQTQPWMRKNIAPGVEGLHQEIQDFYKVK